MTTDATKVIELAQKWGVKRLRIGDVEVELHAAPAGHAEPVNPALLREIFREEDPDEVLFYAVGGAGKVDHAGNPIVPPLLGEDVDAPR